MVTANRYGRVVDRIRALLHQINANTHASDSQTLDILHQQIDFLYKRANNLRIAAIMGGASIFCIALTIFMIFASRMFQWPFCEHIAEYAFLLSLVLLLSFIVIFIHDFGISLHVLKLELASFSPTTHPSKNATASLLGKKKP